MQHPAVIELQILCQDESKPITQLLRQALVIATKLDIEDFVDWCNNELKWYIGYKKKGNIPPYRVFFGELYASELGTNKLLPVIFSEDILDSLKLKILPESVTEIEDWLTRDDKSYVTLNLDKDLEKMCLDLFRKTMIQDYASLGFGNSVLHQRLLPQYHPVLIVSKSALMNIFSNVRQVILEWALMLEKQGILGENLIFTKQEKEVATDNPNIHIGNFQGILGDVTNSQIQQNNTLTVQQNDFESLKQFLKSKSVSDEDIQQLQTAITLDPQPTTANSFGEKVSAWFGNMMTKAVSNAWQIELAIASNLLTDALNNFYGLV